MRMTTLSLPESKGGQQVEAIRGQILSAGGRSETKPQPEVAVLLPSGLAVGYREKLG